MCRLARPQDLFLHLGQPLEPDLDGEVAPSDHHAHLATAHRGEQQFGEVFERRDVLDLEDQADVVGIAPIELGLEPLDVGRIADEREVHHVGMPCDEVEVGEIFRGERIESQVGVGEVDPLASLEVGAARAHVGDRQLDLVVGGSLDHAADLAVVEPHSLAGRDSTEHLTERAPDAVDLTRRRRGGRFEVAGQDDAIAHVDAVSLIDRRQDADGDGVALELGPTVDDQSGIDVRCS